MSVHQRRGQLIDGAGARLWVEETGPADAPAVLLVHRMAAQCFEWPDELIDGLVYAGYRSITYDHRGFGWSSAGPPEVAMRFQDLVDDAKAVLDQLGEQRAHLVGSSVGGLIARGVALEWAGDARSLTFIGSSPGDGKLDVWTPEYTEVAMNPPGPSVAERVDYLVNELRVMSDDQFDLIDAQHRAQRCVARGWTLDSLRAVARAARKRSLGERDLELLGGLTMPCCVIHGSNDSVLSLEHGQQLAAAIPGASLVTLDGMNHDIQAHWVPRILDAMMPVMAHGDQRNT